jgi:uncharacterized protein (DUF1778 family)
MDLTEAGMKRDIGVSMRLREDDLEVIDRGAALNGLSRTEFMRRAALQEAQLAVLNESLIRMSPDGFDHFVEAIEGAPAPMPDKARERIARSFANSPKDASR